MKRFLAALLLGFACFSMAGAQELTRTSHPRLIMDGREFREVRKAVLKGDNEPLVLLHEACMASADAALTAPALIYEKDASGRRILGVSRSALSRIFCCAYAWRFTGEKRYLQHAEQDILDVCAFPDWNPSHFLDVAEMAAAVGLGYDWLYLGLKPSTRRTVVRTLREFAFEPSLDTTDAWFYRRTHNWNQVCNGGLVCAALATFESHPETARELIRKAVSSNLPAMVASYSPDGNYTEGPNYWEYGTVYETFMLTLMESCLGTDYGLGEVEGFARTPYYVLYSCGTTHRMFNFYDNAAAETPHSGMWYFAARQDNPSLLYNELRLLRSGAYRRFPDRFLPMLTLFASRLDFSSVKAPEEKVFAGRGETPVVLVRTGWEDGPEDQYLAVKGGKAISNHGHMDVGSFVYDAYGVRWAMDYGAELYARTEKAFEAFHQDFWAKTQDTWRWKLFRYNNRQHNTLTVNDRDHRIAGAATVREFYTEGPRLGVRMDLTPVFWGDLALAERTAVLCDEKYLEVSDRLAAPAERPAAVRWTLVSEAEPALTSEGIVLSKNGVRMLLHTEGGPVEYRIWSSDPKDYDSPLREVDSPNPGTWICGYEARLEPGQSVTLVTTLKRL